MTKFKTNPNAHFSQVIIPSEY